MADIYQYRLFTAVKAVMQCGGQLVHLHQYTTDTDLFQHGKQNAHYFVESNVVTKPDMSDSFSCPSINCQSTFQRQQ